MIARKCESRSLRIVETDRADKAGRGEDFASAVDTNDSARSVPDLLLLLLPQSAVDLQVVRWRHKGL